MKFDFENLGFVDKGTVELSDLTLICGPNNVGKTYVSYSIYGFINWFKKNIHFPLTQEQITVLKNEGSLAIDLKNYSDNLTEFIEKASKEYSKTLDNLFNSPEELFSESRVGFSLLDKKVNFEKEYRQQTLFGTSERLLFDKAPEETILSIALQVSGKSKLSNRILLGIVNDAIANCLLSSIIPKSFIVTSERTGIALFYKELDISKNSIIEQLTENDKQDPLAILNSMRSRYAKPIQDNIDIIRDYDNLSKQKSFIRQDREKYKSILDALQDLLGGSYKIVAKQVLYQPKKERNKPKVIVPLYAASSSIKALLLIDLYINSLAEKDGLLIIDEPELNLHPDNQRKMANLLARLVNAGIKVMVTTHSDYFIREINNFIMITNKIKNKESIMKKGQIQQDDLLNPEQVKAYNLKTDHTIQEVEVDKFGINLEIFDDLIADANSLTDDIYYSVEDK